MPATPKYATKPRKRAKNLLPRIEAVAERLGHPLIPWQRDFIAIGTQLKYGRFERDTVVGTVPRQSGKTVAVRAVLIDHAIHNPGSYGTYVANKRTVAAKRLRDMALVVKRSGLDPQVRVTLGVGNEVIEFSNGSLIDIQSANSAGHSDSIDIAVLDEAWDIPELVLGGILPAMSARPDPQLWVVSTQGSLQDSHLLNRLCDTARSDPQGPIAYLEYSMPDGAHPYDRERWHEWMPAFEHFTNVRQIESDIDRLDAGEFRRAYGNIPTATMGEVIPLDWWQAQKRDFAIPRGVTIAADATRLGSAVAIAYMLESDDDELRWHLDPIEYRDKSEPDASWVVDVIRQLARYSPEEIAVDPASDLAAYVPALQEVADSFGVPLRKYTLRERGAADTWLLKGLRNETITHGSLPALEEAVEGAVTRHFGDLWRFDRMRAVVDMSPLIACAMAGYAAMERELLAPQAAIF